PEGGYLDASLNREVYVSSLLVPGFTFTADRGNADFVANAAVPGPTGAVALRNGNAELGYPSISDGGTARQMLSGFFVPERSGSYVFDLDANDQASLWFETSGSGVTGSTGLRSLVVDTEARGSTRSTPIDLLAGRRYYFELRHAETRNVTVDRPWPFSDDFDGTSFARLGYLVDDDRSVQPLTADRVQAVVLLPDALTATITVPTGRLSLAPNVPQGITVDSSSTATRVVVRGSAQALQAYLGAPGQVFYDGNAQSISVQVSGAQSGRPTVDRKIVLPRVTVSNQADAFSITGTAATIADYLSRPGNLTFTSADVFRLELKGDFVVGSTVRVAGIAASDVVYTVTAADLSVKGDGSGGAATAAQVASHVGAR
ncbi:MAG: hypothetical protein EBU70_14700, partial [Actinobacteria bacterium]|nr:hypothetical protein [Actinomycetota bacterium]